jgi:hypothetical protein
MYLFICQTPFQLSYVKRIILKRKIDSKKIIIIHSGLIINEFKGQIQFINTKSLKGFFSEMLVMKKTIFTINNLLKNKTKIQLFIPHIGGFIANYLFFVKKFKSQIDVNFYYEGVLYFYEYKEKLHFFHIQRIVMSIFMGFVYKYKPQILPIDSKRINHIFTPIKHITKGDKKKMIEVSLGKIYAGKKNQTQEKTCHFLILGGPIVNLGTYYINCLDLITKHNNYSVNSKIFYKGHASFLTHNKKLLKLFDKIAKENRIQYDELDLKKSIEFIIEEFDITEIYSYYSSSLINLKLLGDSYFKIHCIIDKSEKLNEDLKRAFEYLNVKIIKC